MTRNALNQARHRDKLRGQGMRLLQIWVPDTRAPGFAEEYARQAKLVAASYSEEDLDWLDDNLDDLLELLDEQESRAAARRDRPRRRPPQ